MHCIIRYCDSKRCKNGPEYHIVDAIYGVKNFEPATWAANRSYKAIWEGKDKEGNPFRARYAAQVLVYGPKEEMKKRLNDGKRITVPPLAPGESMSSESEESETDATDKPVPKKAKVAQKEEVGRQVSSLIRKQRANLMVDRVKLLQTNIADESDELHNCQYKKECVTLQEALETRTKSCESFRAKLVSEIQLRETGEKELAHLKDDMALLSKLNVKLQLRIDELEKGHESTYALVAEEVISKIESRQDLVPVPNVKIELLTDDATKRMSAPSTDYSDVLVEEDIRPKTLYKEYDNKVYIGSTDTQDIYMSATSYKNLMGRNKLGTFINDAIPSIWSSTKLVNRSWSGQKASHRTEWNTQEATPERKDILYKLVEHKILTDDPNASKETIKEGLRLCEPKFRAKVSTERNKIKSAKEKAQKVSEVFGGSENRNDDDNKDP